MKYYKLNLDHSITEIPRDEYHNAGIKKIVRSSRGDVDVSTVFLGMDYDGAMGIFETMIFGGPHDQEYCVRASTYDEAIQEHIKACKVAYDNYDDNEIFIDML